MKEVFFIADNRYLFNEIREKCFFFLAPSKKKISSRVQILSCMIFSFSKKNNFLSWEKCPEYVASFLIYFQCVMY
ncbi:MAG: hypothetical protein BV458_03040 [Thermoplasmata archaeon M9B2D]|nr:MAG: hypothetical protein BV458_03040 [Thermoplasmata archaeon M9B2D]